MTDQMKAQHPQVGHPGAGHPGAAPKGQPGAPGYDAEGNRLGKAVQTAEVGTLSIRYTVSISTCGINLMTKKKERPLMNSKPSSLN